MQNDFDVAQIYRRLTARWLWVVRPLSSADYWAVGVISSACLRSRGRSRDRDRLYRADVPDDITVRQAFDRVRDCSGRRHAERVVAPPNAAGTRHSRMVEDFRERIRLSERPDGWVLAVNGSDGPEVERLAQAWAEAAVDQLKAASTHAIRAAEWQNQLFEVSCRLVSQGEESARWICRSAPPGGDAEALPASILAEVEASRGIPPVLTYSLLQGSQGTGRPVVWGRGSIVLGGVIIGLTVGSLAVASRRRSPRAK
jgi:hypothetical protein